MNKTTSLPDLILEQYVLHELDEREMKEIGQLEKENPDVKKRIDAIRQSNEEILSMYPVSIMAESIETKKAKARFTNWKPGSPATMSFIGVAGLAAAAAVTVFFTPVLRQNEIPTESISATAANPDTSGNQANNGNPNIVLPSQAPDTTRLKGSEYINTPRIALFKKIIDEEQETAKQLLPKEVLHQGDEIQVRYYSGKYSHGIIISIDGRGAVTLHSPSPRTESTELVKYKDTFIKNSFKLDDAPYFERFFFILGNTPIQSIDGILLSAEKLGSDPVNAEKADLELPKEFTVTSIIVYKEER
ncbi:MAG: hypothetical protein JW904_05445 [Spirochaetales bacterium]|nr:hypothetical protein [Spirochaetales bacterium]